jgi:anti-anti-sigma factor
MTDQHRAASANTGHHALSPFGTTITDNDAAIMVTITRNTRPVPADTDTSCSTTVVAISGDIDAATAPLLQRALAQALSDLAAVCCDLSQVAFFGAAAANTLLAAHQHATAHGRVFALRGVHGMTARVWAVADPGGVVARQT